MDGILSIKLKYKNLIEPSGYDFGVK